ncbi:hypothetical protein Tco_1445828 [Tanacetum coccineum]
MSRRYGYMFHHMKKQFMTRKDMDTIANKVKDTLKVVVPKMVNETTDQNMRDNLPMVVSEGIKLEREKTKVDIALMVADAVRKEQERTRAKLSLQVSNDLATNVPPHVDAFLRNYMNNNILHVHPATSTKNCTASHVDPCRVDAFRKHDHEDHHDNDAHPKGESCAKRQQTSEKGTYVVGESSSQAMEESTLFEKGTQEQQEFDAWFDHQGTNDDEVPSEEVSPELLAKMLGK